MFSMSISINGGSVGGAGDGGGGATGPCGACKYLRRKCSSGCVFAPYFHSDQGSAHFAAVHKIFGASNASKMLLGMPPHKRLDAVVSMCYEALARVRDPVYGCVSQIFTLQQQVLKLRAELAYAQARLATLHCFPLPPQQPSSATMYVDEYRPSANNDRFLSEFPSSMRLDDNSMQLQQQKSWSTDMTSFVDQGEVDDGEELQSLARELISKHLPEFAFRPPTNSP